MNDKHAHNRLDAANAARAKALAGKSPLARAEEKTKIALDWIYRWRWSAPSTLDLLVGITGRGLGARMVKQHLLIRTATASGGGRKGVPASILTLSKIGLEEIERERETLLPYELDPYRIRQDQLRHDHLAQVATAKNILNGSVQSFLTEKELAAKSTLNAKQPDIVWRLRTGITMAVEVELSAKWGRDFDHFIHGVVESLEKQRFDVVLIATDSRAILNRYKAALEPRTPYQIWHKDAQRRWMVKNTAEVPVSLKGKVAWLLLES